MPFRKLSQRQRLAVLEASPLSIYLDSEELQALAKVCKVCRFRAGSLVPPSLFVTVFRGEAAVLANQPVFAKANSSEDAGSSSTSAEDDPFLLRNLGPGSFHVSRHRTWDQSVSCAFVTELL